LPDDKWDEKDVTQRIDGPGGLEDLRPRSGTVPGRTGVAGRRGVGGVEVKRLHCKRVAVECERVRCTVHALVVMVLWWGNRWWWWWWWWWRGGGGGGGGGCWWCQEIV